MKKLGSNQQASSPAVESMAAAVTLRESAAVSARKLIFQLQLDVDGHAGGGQPVNDEVKKASELASVADPAELSALKERCMAFGIDVSTAELILAGLFLLAQQTETALEVALLQSLRADRTFTKRRSKR